MDIHAVLSGQIDKNDICRVVTKQSPSRMTVIVRASPKAPPPTQATSCHITHVFCNILRPGLIVCQWRDSLAWKRNLRLTTP